MKKTGILAVTLLLLLSLTACGATPADDPQNSSGGSVSSDVLDSDQDEASSDIDPIEVHAELDQTVEMSGWKLTLNSYSFTQMIQCTQGTITSSYTTTEDKTLLVVNATLENTTDDKQIFLPTELNSDKPAEKILYDRETEYSAPLLPNHLPALHNKTVKASAIVDGEFVFELPVEVIDSGKSLTFLLTDYGVALTVDLREATEATSQTDALPTSEEAS